MTEFHKQWIAALRSDQYKQGEGFLRSKDKTFCCLGVACDLLGKDGWVKGDNDEPFGYKDANLTAYPSQPMLKQIGINNDTGNILWKMNDGKYEYAGNKKSFSEIADYLEEKLS